MSASNLHDPNFRFSQGVGFRLYAFQFGGTTTPVSTYADPSGETPNEWPVILADAGNGVGDGVGDGIAPIFVTSNVTIDIRDGDDASLPGYPSHFVRGVYLAELDAVDNRVSGRLDGHDDALYLLQSRATDLEGRATDLEGRATAVEERAKALEDRADALEDRADATDGRLTTDEEDIEALQDRATALEDRATSLEGRADALEDWRATDEPAIDTLQGQMGTANSNISNLQGRMGTAEGDINTLQGGVSICSCRSVALRRRSGPVITAGIRKVIPCIVGVRRLPLLTGSPRFPSRSATMPLPL